ncbi:MAG: CotH kinase family protein [Eubacteriales bacterium]
MKKYMLKTPFPILNKIILKYIQITLLFILLIIGSIIYIRKNIIVPNTISNIGLPLFNVEFSISQENEDGATCFVSWWYNSLYEKYYLFLPTHADNEKVRLILPSETTLLWDGVEIQHGELMYLSTGTHTLEEIETNQIYQVEVLQSDTIGTIYIETDSGTTQYLEETKGNEETGSITILTTDGIIEYSGKLDYIRGRGNDEWTENHKKSFQIQLSESENLFQMGSNKTWLLLANTADPTEMRNGITFDMATNIGLEFTPQSVWMDFYINGIYTGTYQMTEKIEVDESRVNIRNLESETTALNPNTLLTDFSRFMNDPTESLYSAKGFEIENNPEDITGGYLLEIEMSDRYGLENSGFITSRGQAVVIKSPENASREQVEYISQLYQEMEDAIYSENGINPTTNKSYTDYLDIESFASKYIIEETVKNLDAAYTSQYIYKYPDEISDKFYAGPVWDYDKSLGVELTSQDIDLNDAYTFYVNTPLKDSSLWYGLYQQTDFLKQVQYIYSETTSVYLSDIREKIELLASSLESSIIMNMIRWNQAADNDENEKIISYYENVELIINYCENRKIFLDSQWLD